MMWQDWVLAIGGFAFSIALIPSIRSKIGKPTQSTCAMTAFFLWLYCLVYASFDMWLSLTAGILSALCWSILLFQKR